MKRIGVDIGTTTISAVVLEDESRRVLESRTVPGGTFLPSREAVAWERVQDAEFMIRKAKAVLDELLDRHPDAVSIGLTGQMHGILYLDAQGRAVSPLYTWQDQRGNLPEFDGRSMVDLIHDLSPEPAAAGYGLVTHAYLCRKGQVPAGAVSLCTIADYFGMMLTGRKTPLLHISMAASLGLFVLRETLADQISCDTENVPQDRAAEEGKLSLTRLVAGKESCKEGFTAQRRKFRFCTEVLEKLGADPSVLPEVTDEFAVLGSYRDCSVTAAIGDNQASFLGAVGFAPDTALLNVGTGGQISILSEQFFEAEGIEARPLTKDKFLLAGSSLCGGRAWAILEKFFRSYMTAAGAGDQEQYEVMAKLAQEAYVKKEPELSGTERGFASDESKKDLTFAEDSEFSGAGTNSVSERRDSNFIHVETTFHGTRTDPDKRGSITNLSENNFTPQNLALGVLIGIARELHDLYVVIHEGTGIEARRLVASGNGVRRNPVLQKILEEMFQARLEISVCEEEAACGAAASSKGRLE